MGTHLRRSKHSLLTRLGIISGSLLVLSVILPFSQASAAGTPFAEPELPKIPNRNFKVTDYGAVGDGKTLNTVALQKAIDTCGAAGGGTVHVTAGVYLTGPLHLVSHMALSLENGSTIQATDKFKDFGLPDPLPATQPELDKLKSSLQPLIHGSKLTDIAIIGTGKIDGMGWVWWDRSVKALWNTTGAPVIPRPNMIILNNCTRVLVQGVTLSNSPQFHLVPHACSDLIFDGIHISTSKDSPNTDGMDPSNCRKMVIRNCVIDCGDDNIAFKANKDGPTEDVLVENCTFKHGHGASIGSETNGGMKNIEFRNCKFEDTVSAIRIKSARSRGGLIENISYHDLTMKNVGAAIDINFFYYDKTEAKNPDFKPVTDMTPSVHGIHISNITCVGAKTAGQILGLPEAPGTDIVLENVNITASSGFDLQDVKGITLKNVSIQTCPKPVQPSPTPGSSPAVSGTQTRPEIAKPTPTSTPGETD